MNHDKATPRPWDYRIARIVPEAPPFGFTILKDGKGVPVAACGVASEGIPIIHKEWRHLIPNRFTEEELEANAILIVTAVNAWDDIDLLKARIKELENND